MVDTDTPVKKTRTRKAPAVLSPTETSGVIASFKNSFDELFKQIKESQTAYENLEKEITETKQLWVKEQKEHEVIVAEAARQEEIVRKRDAETYAYETELTRKKAEDFFKDKLAGWEKELAERKEELVKDKKELEELRRQAGQFPLEKDKAIKDALAVSQKELSEKTAGENRLREQEFNAQREILNLKIANLAEEKIRLNKEIEELKRLLEEAQRQLKEVAVKVIEAGGNPSQNPAQNPAI